MKKCATYIVLSLFAAVVLVPLVWVVSASFKPNEAFYGSPWAIPDEWTLSNYAVAWTKAGIGDYFLNSAWLTAVSLVLLLALAVPCAYALARFSFHGRRVVRLLLTAGLFVNISYIAVPIFLLLSDAQRATGIQLLNDHAVTAVVYAASALSFTVYLLSNFFETLPRSYEEAAYIDGCGYMGTLWRVMVPLSRPAVVTAVLFQFLSFWNEYIIAVTLLTDEEVKTLPVGLMNLMKAQNAAAEYGALYAGLVTAMLPTLLLYLLLQKHITGGIQLGGLKG